MPYLPQTTSPFLISLPPWNTRFLLPYLQLNSSVTGLNFECSCCEASSRPPSELGPNVFIYLCYQVRSSPLSHSGPLALKESQSSFQGAVWLVWWNTCCYYQPCFVFLRSRQKNFMFQTLSLSTTIPCLSLVKLCLLFLWCFYQHG